jgi:hypothetical protein
MHRDESRTGLAAALKGRREEIEQAISARVHAIGDPDQVADSDYLGGLRSAIIAAIDHTIDAAGVGDERALRAPDPLLFQARFAARRRVPLETMLRRYLAGHAVLSDFVVEEAQRLAISPAILRRVLRAQSATTDRVLEEISATYLNEKHSVHSSTSERQTQHVRRLLNGELLDPTDLDYDFDRWHLAVVVRGAPKKEVLARLAGGLDARRLTVAGDEDALWVWLGTRQRLEPDRVEAIALAGATVGSSIGVGEPGRNRSGWRLTHEQARAALSVALRGPAVSARYANVAMLASAIQDDLFATSLRELYLAPLEMNREDDEVLRQTLRAYFAADRNVTSTAAALGVSRNTVTYRLQQVEKCVGFALSTRAPDIAVALQLDDLTGSSPHRSVSTTFT